MCVMFLHYISEERPKLPGIKSQSNISVAKFALLNSVDSLEHEVSLLFHLKGLHFIIKLTS